MILTVNCLGVEKGEGIGHIVGGCKKLKSWWEFEVMEWVREMEEREAAKDCYMRGGGEDCEKLIRYR